MAKNNNFKWVMQDIESTLMLNVMYTRNGVNEKYGVFSVTDVLETPCDELEIENGNINDLTNLLTLGVVRFTNIVDSADVIEIPFKKLYLLYKNSWRSPDTKIPFSKLDYVYSEAETYDYEVGKLMRFSELDTFSVIDGTVRNDLFLFSIVSNAVSVDLISLIEIAYRYEKSDYMREKFDALKAINKINEKRLVNDEKERTLRQ